MALTNTATAVKPKHVHKLRRHKYKSGNIVYFCSLPDCNFKIAPALAIGKRSICNRCDNEFILNEYSVRLAKPHCENCHKPKDSKEELPPEISHTREELRLTEKINPNNFNPTPTSDLAKRLQQSINHAKHEDEDEDEI